ncbi:MAG: flippase-like domain-containing protein [Acidimicrobiales bacterium]|nr:flippase-like domain-containing protein [Acidimicrobiales bacterium]
MDDTPAAPARYERHPGDSVRVVLGLMLTGTGVLGLALTRDAIAGLESDLYRLLTGFPEPLVRIVLAIVQVALLSAPVAVVIGIIRYRHWRAAVMALVAATATTAILFGLHSLLGRPGEAVAVGQGALDRSAVLAPDFPRSIVVAATVAAVTAASPWITRPWRRAFWALVVLAVISRLLSGTELPLDIFTALAAAWTIGSATLVAFGSPRPRGESPEVVREALRANGLDVVELRLAPVRGRAPAPFFASLAGGERLFVKVLGRDQRDADLLDKLYRYLRFRGIEDEAPFPTAKRAIEHETLCGLFAERLGARTPSPRLLASVGQGSTLLAQDAVSGENLDEAPPERLADAALHAVWEQVAIIHGGRVAHRDLRLANVILDQADQPWLIGFGFAEVGASERRLAIDVAELLCSTALVVGAARAVAAAVEVLGTEPVAAALPFLQPPALSTATARGLRRRKGLLAEVTEKASAATGVEAVEPEKLQRVSGRSLLMTGLLVAMFYILLPQLGDVPASIEALEDATWGFLPFVLVLAGASYLSSAFVFMGTVDARLPVWPALEAQLASAFVNRVTPANVGGMALRIRFLQKRGIEAAAAASAVGLNSGATGLVKTVLLVVFVVLTGFGSLGGFDVSGVVWALGGVVLLLAVGWVVLFGTGWGRAKVVEPLLRSVRHALRNLQAVLTSPSKVVLVVGGSIGMYLANIAALFLTVEAFGGGVSFSRVAVVYLGGTTIAGVAPTPGNVGAVEAALAAGLSAAGMDSAVALSAVLVFRLATYWLPTLPAWGAFHAMERAGEI